ncbi:uncharacterized protein LOC115785971 [Archocentrus centrarchus]|uniref:uncharacterized protein LOC115785971 n=1 Tax=Archocentrus centrarchus TaxID=63155 RepID=UPI0011EA1FB7|nr:uncharacterized protein LOC115785971 [Archocentrus centrarchus]
MYRDSSNPKLAQAGVVVKTGRKWSAQAVVLDAESRLRHKDLVVWWLREEQEWAFPRHLDARGAGGRRSKESKEAKIQEEVRAAVEEGRSSRATGLRQQEAWMSWEQAINFKVTWMDLWLAEPHHITFLVRALYDILPSPANLGKVETPNSPLCPARGSLEHVLSSCPTALHQSRYTWRHNQVLKPVAEVISKGIGSRSRVCNTTGAMAFVRAGEQGIQSTARDWKLSVD